MPELSFSSSRRAFSYESSRKLEKMVKDVIIALQLPEPCSSAGRLRRRNFSANDYTTLTLCLCKMPDSLQCRFPHIKIVYADEVKLSFQRAFCRFAVLQQKSCEPSLLKVSRVRMQLCSGNQQSFFKFTPPLYCFHSSIILQDLQSIQIYIKN